MPPRCLRYLRLPVWAHVAACALSPVSGFVLGCALFVLGISYGAPRLPRDASLLTKALVLVALIASFVGLPLGGVVGVPALVGWLRARCPRCGGGARARGWGRKELIPDDYACLECGHQHAATDLRPWPAVRFVAHLLLIPLQVGFGLVVLGMFLTLALILTSAIVAHLHVLLTILAALWLVPGVLIVRKDRRAGARVRWTLALLPLAVAGVAAPARALVVIPGELGARAELLKGQDRRTRQEGAPLVRIEPAVPFGYRWFADAVIALSGVVVATAAGALVLKRHAHRAPRVLVRDLSEGVFEVEGTVVETEEAPVASPVVRVTRTVRIQGRESGVSTGRSGREFLLVDGTGGILLVDPREATLAPPVGVELLGAVPRLFLSARARWSLLPVGMGWRVERTLLPGDRVRLIARFERSAARTEWVARAVPPRPFLEQLAAPAGREPRFLLTDGSRPRLRLALRGPLVRASFVLLVWLAASSVSAVLLLSRLSYRSWLPEQIASHAPPGVRVDLLLDLLEGSGDAPSDELLDRLSRCRLAPEQGHLEPRLRGLAGHPAPAVRAFVASGLAGLGRGDARALATLRCAIADVDTTVRTAAAAALEALGPAGLAVAEDAVRRAGRPEGRAAAVPVIWKLLDERERSRRMRELLASGEAAVRRAAATLLRRGGAEDVAALLRALEDAHPSVRDAAFLALPEEAASGLPVALLGALMASPEYAVWHRVTRLLASRPSAEVEPLLLRELSSGDETRAARALSELERAKTPPSAAAAAILGRLAADGPALRYGALTQLERMDVHAAGAVPELARWLAALAPEDSLRARVLGLIGKLGPHGAAAIPALEALRAREAMRADVLATLLRVSTPPRLVESNLAAAPLLAFDGAAFRAREGALPRGAEGPLPSTPGLGGPAMPLAPVALSWEPPLALGWDFALELWFRLDAGASVHVLDSNLVSLRVDHGVARVYWRDRTTGELVAGGPLVKGGGQLPATWHHVALVRDGERRTLDAYLDGRIALSVPDLDVVHHTGPEERLVVNELGNELRSLGLGGSDPGRPRGALRSLALYDRHLTAEEVAARALLETERR